MTKLRLDTLEDSPRTIAEKLEAMGCTWEEWILCPMADCVILRGANNVPEKLPKGCERV